MPRRTTLQSDILRLLGQVNLRGGSPDGLSRAEIAARLGYGDRSLSEALRAMTHAGELLVTRAHAPGAKYRVLTYRLSRLGANRARTYNQPPPPALPEGAEPFVGRSRELTELGRAYVKGGTCVVDGVPGVGKTALVRRSLRYVWKSHYPVWITLKGLDPDALVTQVERALESLRPSSRGDALGPPVVGIPAQSIAALLRRARRPVLWVLDDVQGASADTLATVRATLADVTTTPAIAAVLITNRELPWAIPGQLSCHLSLQGLARRDALALTLALGLPEDKFERVYLETLGSPRFLRQGVGVDRFPDTSFAEAVIESLPEDQCRALGTLALLWGGTSADLVRAAGISEPLETALLSRSVLERTEQGLRVVQPLAQHLRETLTWTQAQEAHAFLAKWVPPLPLAERFCHLVESEQVGPASHLAVDERMAIVEEGDPRVLTAALRLAHLLPPGAGRGRLLVVVAEMLRVQGDFVASSSFLRRALEDLPSEDDEALLATVLLVNASLRAGNLVLAEQTVEALQSHPSAHRWTTGSWYAQGTLAQSRGDGEQALEFFTKAARRARQLGQPELLALALLGQVHVMGPQRTKEGLALCQEGSGAVASSGRHDLIRALKGEEALAHVRLGHLDQADDLYQQVLADSRRSAARPVAVVALLGLAFVRSRKGDLKSAVDFAQEAAHTAEALHDRSLTSRAYASLAEQLRKSGARDSALRIARRAKSLALEGGFREHIAFSEEALALASTSTGDQKVDPLRSGEK